MCTELIPNELRVCPKWVTDNTLDKHNTFRPRVLGAQPTRYRAVKEAAVLEAIPEWVRQNGVGPYPNYSVISRPSFAGQLPPFAPEPIGLFKLQNYHDCLAADYKRMYKCITMYSRCGFVRFSFAILVTNTCIARDREPLITVVQLYWPLAVWVSFKYSVISR